MQSTCGLSLLVLEALTSVGWPSDKRASHRPLRVLWRALFLRWFQPSFWHSWKRSFSCRFSAQGIAKMTWVWPGFSGRNYKNHKRCRVGGGLANCPGSQRVEFIDLVWVSERATWVNCRGLSRHSQGKWGCVIHTQDLVSTSNKTALHQFLNSS